MKRIFGIDLGTTYSCIAHVDEHGKPVVIPNSENETTTPSVVFFETADNIVVGQTAKDVASLHPDRVVQTVKRAMGEPNWEWSCFDEVYTPQGISALILRKLVGDAEEVVGEKIEDVVITCPAYFGINEKEATKQAGIIAGLNVHYVIPEPTAAAIAYGIELDSDQTVLVYDLGGGTFDVTVIAVRAGSIEVLATGGERELGGKDWDDAIVADWAAEFETQTGVPADTLLSDMEVYQELLLDAERAKKTLSSRSSITQRVRMGADAIKIEFDRERFDNLTRHFVDRTLAMTEEVLERARDKGAPTIDTLLLVGGSTYMPQVFDRISASFTCQVQRIDPNQIVAKGAALFGYRCQLEQEIIAAVEAKTSDNSSTEEIAEAREEAMQKVAENEGLSLSGLRKVVSKEIINVTSKSFGIEVVDNSGNTGVTNLVWVDERVPTSPSRTFGTHEDNQEGVELRVFENLDRDPNAGLLPIERCTLLGTAELHFLRALPKNSPVQISFSLSADGLLNIHGKDLTTEQEIEARFETRSVLSQEALEEATSRSRALSVS